LKRYSNVYAGWNNVLTAIAFLVAAASTRWLLPSQLIGAGFVLISLALARTIPVEMPGGWVLDLSNAIDMSAAMVLGPAGSLVSLFGRLLAMFVQGAGQMRGLRPGSFAAAAPESIAVFCAGLAAHSLGFLGLRSSHDILVGVQVCAVYLISRALVYCVSNGLRYNMNPMLVAVGVLREPFMWHALQAAAGVFGVYVYSVVPFNLLSLGGFTVFAGLVAYAAILYIDMRSVYWTTLLSLIPAIENEVHYDEGHSERVSAYSVAIARKMSLPEQSVYGIYIGAILHDVGMSGIDERILNKPGRLTAEEALEVAKHVEIGAKIVDKVPFLHPASGIVQHHHERWDGQGYPDGLSGEAIPLGARIVAVADTFAALSSERPYRRPFSVEDALREIRSCTGTQFDPRVVSALEKAVPDEQRWGRDVFGQHYTVDFIR